LGRKADGLISYPFIGMINIGVLEAQYPKIKKIGIKKIETFTIRTLKP